MRKNIKKTFALFLIAVMSFMCLCGFSDDHNKVIDDADLFEYDEINALEDYAKECGKKAKLDIVIHTSDKANSKNVETVARDIYASNNYGYDDCDGSGAILYIDMHQRDFAIFVKGTAVAMIDDDALNDILDDVQEQMIDGDYYDAAMLFIRETYDYAEDFIADNEEALEAWYEGEYADGYELYDATGPIVPFFKTFKNPLICLLVGLVIAAIVTCALFLGSRTKNTVHSRTYIKDGSLQFPVMTERFLYTNTTTRRIQNSSSGGSGGSGGGGGGRSGSRSF